MCGGTRRPIRSMLISYSLSPRVRGNPRPGLSRHRPGRSIPACAGEPVTAEPQERQIPVYPRVCGGTCPRRRECPAGRGLSPRVRGNLAMLQAAVDLVGSIPACAGEPGQIPPGDGLAEVYPRVCGGTRSSSFPLLAVVGLSPRVRGNQRRCDGEGDKVGSIPACAGEPRVTSGAVIAWRVYPRVCGGTWPRVVDDRSSEGLSPRVRGNPTLRMWINRGKRSIPACAGEPPPFHAAGILPQVYPRVCGGTPYFGGVHAAARGLSPRVRGNRPAAIR